MRIAPLSTIGWLAGAALSLLAALAQAATGLVELAGLEADSPVTVFYPSSSAAAPVRRGPFELPLAWQGVPVHGNGRLVVISHGSGGSPWVHADLASALVAEGFVVAMPEHRGDNYRDKSAIGPESWKRRPAEASRAIDAVVRDTRFAARIAAEKVGLYGMSAGGHTALTVAGGRWSPAGLAGHCGAHIAADFPACVGLAAQLRGDVFDSVKIWTAKVMLRWRFTDTAWQTYHDPRFAAVVAAVPYAADFDMTSFAAPRVPLGIVGAEQDRWLAPRFHSGAVLQACAPCERVAEVPGGGHGALLSPLPPKLSGPAAELLGDPPGFDRSILREIDRKIVAFFRRHLLP